jgi:hypothetical protein
MSQRSSPLAAPPVALDRVPRLVDVLDEPVADVDAVLEDCLSACRGFLEAEIERRVQAQLDEHAQARFEAWLAQARVWWDAAGAPLVRPKSTASNESDPLDVGPIEASASSTSSDEPTDWVVLRDRLAACLANRQAR